MKNVLDKAGLTYLWGKIKGMFALKTDVDDAVDALVSRGESLVVNGNGILGDNTNFSALVFDPTECDSSAGSFKCVGSKNPSTDEFFPVNPALYYKVSVSAKTLLGTGRLYVFLNFYDSDKRNITASHTMWSEGGCTELTQDLKVGDTVVHCADLSGWNAVNTRYFGITFWNYTNAKGYTYPPYTYTRNCFSSLYNSADDVDVENGTIALKTAWTGNTIPAGTKISRYESGGTYRYIISSKVVPANWTHYSGVYTGVDSSGRNVLTKFPPGVAYANVGFLINYQTPSDTTWLTNVNVTSCAGNADIPKEHHLGLFSTITTLRAAYPTPEVGDWALVGDTTPFAIYRCSTAGTWTDTGQTYDGGTIDLADYVTKTEFDELDATVNGGTTETAVTTTWTSDIGISGVTGDELSMNRYYGASDFIQIPNGVESIRLLTLVIRPGASFNNSVGLAFYDSNQTFISGIVREEYDHGGTSVAGMVERTYNVPEGARFLRTTCMTSQEGNWYCYLKSSTGGGLVERMNTAELNIDSALKRAEIWSGTQAQYDALSATEKAAVIAFIEEE